MTMTATNVYMNWKAVTVTPQGGSVVAITEVLDVEIVDQETIEMWQADGTIYPTLAIRAAAMRGLKITGGSINLLQAIPRGTPCVVVAILEDAVNVAGGAGSGSLTHTLSNAVLAEVPRSGPSNKFAGGSATFVSYSTDGATNPLITVQA